MRAALVMIAGLLVSASAFAQPPPLPPAQLVAEVERSYATAKQLTASFEQVVTNATMGFTRTRSGKVYLSRPDKMRWDYLDAKHEHDKSFIFDGAVLWIVQPKNLQVLRHTVQSSGLPAAVSFLAHRGKLARDFTIGAPSESARKAHGVPGGVLVALTPKRPSAQVARLYFVIDPAAKRVVRSVVIDSSGNTNTFVFRKVNAKPRIKPSVFVFDPASVPNYRIVTVGANARAAPPPRPPPAAPAP